MQIDELLSALAIMRQRMMVIGGMYDTDQVRYRMLIIDVMRDYVLQDDVKRFTEYCQQKLSNSPDTMVDLLGEMFADLGIGEDAMWDDFEQQFLLTVS